MPVWSRSASFLLRCPCTSVEKCDGPSVGSTGGCSGGSAEELETVSGGIAVAAGIFFNGPSPYFAMSYWICLSLSIGFASTRAHDEISI